MIKLRGKYGSAIVYTDLIEEECIAQIIQLLNQPFVEGCQIRVMPDCHAGAGCVIGFTADLGSKVIPNLVGVDIGCGVLTVPLGDVDIDFQKFDNVIRNNIPYGFEVNQKIKAQFDKLKDMYCYDEVVQPQTDRILKAIGSLGGGNHFIEVDEDENKTKYLLIHTGSRHLGVDVCKYYQNKAGQEEHRTNINTIIATLKTLGRESEIEKTIKKHKEKILTIPKDLQYLTGENKSKYLHDMKICQEYARLNRLTIAESIIINYFNFFDIDPYYYLFIQKSLFGKEAYFDTVHNYIGDDNIIRKGAVAAYEGQRLVIPINMRDGALICKGKGNPDYNYSAPHGAGRIMSRAKAKATINLDDYKASMARIYSTCVNQSTIDESAFAYKNIDSIVGNIQDTVEIEQRIYPIYNFKASN